MFACQFRLQNFFDLKSVAVAQHAGQLDDLPGDILEAGSA